MAQVDRMVAHSEQNDLLLSVLSVILQALAYGVSIAIVLIAVFSLNGHGFKSRPNMFIVLTTLSVFTICTAYLAVSVCAFVSRIMPYHMFNESGIRELFNAITTINLIFADGIVVWRMSVLCTGYIPKVVLGIPIIFLGITGLSVCATIVVRIVLNLSPGIPKDHPKGNLAMGLNVSQVAALVFSLLTNITATTLIGIWTWKYQKSVAENTSGATRIRSRAQRVMILLTESGAIYCVSSIIAVAGLFVRIPPGTLGDIYTGVHVQIAGMYPVLVMILIKHREAFAARIPSCPSTGCGPMNDDKGGFGEILPSDRPQQSASFIQ